jgi:hypothetical protein
LKSELEVVEDLIKVKNAIDEHKEAIKKYTKTTETVRNNREFNSLTKRLNFKNLKFN